MRKTLFAALLSLPCVALANPGDGAFDLRCEREMKPHIEVISSIATYKLNNTISSRVLNTRGTYATVHQMLLGMTSGTNRTEILLDGPSLQDKPNRRECLAPRILVQLAYQPIDVYVAREFNTYSCAYREVFAHEMRHVSIYRENLPLVEDKIRKALAERYGDRPMYAPLGQGLDLLEQDVDNWLRPMIRDELARVEKVQRELDSPDEVFRLSHSCGGEVASMMGSSF